jgi:hypothetical protein
MERLYIHCKGGGTITVMAKGKSANVMRTWNEKYARFHDSFKKAWIQRYPKKDNPPFVLVDNTAA